MLVNLKQIDNVLSVMFPEVFPDMFEHCLNRFEALHHLLDIKHNAQRFEPMLNMSAYKVKIHLKNKWTISLYYNDTNIVAFVAWDEKQRAVWTRHNDENEIIGAYDADTFTCFQKDNADLLLYYYAFRLNIHVNFRTA